MLGQAREHSYRRRTIAVTHAVERLRNGGLHRTDLLFVRTLSTHRQSEYGTPAITRVINASHHLLLHQPLQDPGQCTRVQVEDRGEFPRREPRKQANHAQHEALRSRDADLTCHPLGPNLEPVDDGPQQLHELQHIR
jgi:hypothetical protein